MKQREYRDYLNNKVVWDTIKLDLPKIKPQIAGLLRLVKK